MPYEADLTQWDSRVRQLQERVGWHGFQYEAWARSCDGDASRIQRMYLEHVVGDIMLSAVSAPRGVKLGLMNDISEACTLFDELAPRGYNRDFVARIGRLAGAYVAAFGNSSTDASRN